MAIKKEEVELALNETKVDPELSAKVIAYLEELEAQKKAEKEDKEKTEYRNIGFLLCGKDYDDLPITERPIFLSKIEADEDHNLLVGKLKNVFANYNESKKGRKNPAHSFGELIQKASRSFFAQEDLKPIKDENILLINVDSIDFFVQGGE